jgi:hypothetical protein
MRRRFRFAVVLASPVFLIAMLPHFIGLELPTRSEQTLRLLEFSLSSPAVFWAATDYYRRR